MSVRAMSIVWQAKVSPPTSKLTLLALADWSNDDGASLHPSMRSVAAKVGISTDQARRIVRGFMADGLLSVVANAHGGSPGTTPSYLIHLDRVAKLPQTTGTDARAGADATPGTDAADGLHGRRRRLAPMPETAGTHASLTTMNHQRTTNEPPIGRERTRKRDAPSVEKPMATVDQLVEAGFPADVANEFIAHKAALKAPLTERAWRDHLAEALKAGWSPLQAAEKVMAKNWKGFEAKYVASEKPPGQAKSRADLLTDCPSSNYEGIKNGPATAY